MDSIKLKKISVTLLFLAGTIYGFSLNANAQNTLGFRFTPNIISNPLLINPSPRAFREKLLFLDAGVDFTHIVNRSEGSPRSDFLGIDLKLNYNVSKTPDLTDHGIDEIRSAKYRKSIFAEALGSGIGISGNFDMRFKKDRNDGLGFRTGLGLGTFYRSIAEKKFGADKRYITFPVMVNYITGTRRSGIETAIGFTSQVAFSKVADGEQSYVPHGSLNVGYRLQPLKDGLIVRATWTPLFDSEGFYPAWAGFSIGYSFK